MRCALSAAAVVLSVAGLADAAEEEDYLLKSTEDLATLCGAPEDPSAIHMCHGYLVGAHHVFSAVGHALGAPLYCLPQDGSVSRDQAVRDFVTWVEATPDAASMPPSDGLLQWVRQTFPCS